MFTWVKSLTLYSSYNSWKDYELIRNPDQLLEKGLQLSPTNSTQCGRVLFSLAELPLNVKYLAPNLTPIERVSEFLVVLGVEGGKQYQIAIEEDKTKTKENKAWRKEFNKGTNKQDRVLVHTAATRIQSYYRGQLARRKYKGLVRRAKIAREINSTEETYLNELTTMIEVFLIPLRDSNLVQPNDLKLVFSEVESLQLFHKQFFKKLNDRIKRNPLTPIGELFLELPLYFPAYTNYINNYERAIQAFEEISKREKVALILKDAQAKEQCRGKNLPAFMIIPIQRVPRYVMLLQDFVKNTKETDLDYTNLVNALEQIKKMATAINSRKREAENLNEVVRVHYSLVSKSQKDLELLQPHRRFVHEGEVVLLQDGDWSSFSEEKNQTAHLFLFNDILLVTLPTKKSRIQGKTRVVLKKLKHKCGLADTTAANYQDSGPYHLFVLSSNCS
eukprot:TRINITY_DN5718_c0_g1_i2.p1 TRINITY_DN5718_c0_g1~~TRINITY_DN5718_c0_g1_i2.p1  ORF type:complete len:446 (-),score=73.67 TRINITY_DN5718_c0_g1_i2:173-1510(-)